MALVIIIGGIVTTVYYAIQIRVSLEEMGKRQAMDDEVDEDEDDLWELPKVQASRLARPFRVLIPKRTSSCENVFLPRFLSRC
jgi:hypothetical protein